RGHDLPVDALQRRQEDRRLAVPHRGLRPARGARQEAEGEDAYQLVVVPRAYSRGLRAYAASNAASSRGWVPRRPSTTRLAQSKYSCRRSSGQLAGGWSATSRRFAILSASLTSFAASESRGACSICRRLRSAFS